MATEKKNTRAKSARKAKQSTRPATVERHSSGHLEEYAAQRRGWFAQMWRLMKNCEGWGYALKNSNGPTELARRVLQVADVIRAALFAFHFEDDDELGKLASAAKGSTRRMHSRQIERVRTINVDFSEYGPRGWCEYLGDPAVETRPEIVERTVEGIRLFHHAWSPDEFGQYMLRLLRDAFSPFRDLLPEAQRAKLACSRGDEALLWADELKAARKAFLAWKDSQLQPPAEPDCESVLREGLKAFGIRWRKAANLFAAADMRVKRTAAK